MQLNFFKKKNNLLDLFIFAFFGLFIFVILNYTNNFYNIEKELRHWTTIHDEIHQIYNALLYNNGFQHEFIAHPSAILILLLSIQIKIFQLLSFLDVSTINQFISSDNFENNLNKLFFVSRILIAFIAILFSFMAYLFFKLITNDILIAFVLTIIFIFSSGFLYVSNTIGSEQLSAFLIFFSLFFLCKFLIEQKNAEVYLFLCFFLIFASIIQKMQVFFLVIPSFFSLIYFLRIKKDLNLAILNLQYTKKSYFIIFILVCLIIFLKSLVAYKSIESFSFLIVNYFLINLIFYLFIKKFQSEIYKNLIIYNFLLISSYILLKLIFSFHPSSNLEVFNISFAKMFSYIKSYISRDAESFQSINNFVDYFQLFINYFVIVINKFFLELNFQSILIYFNLVCLLIFCTRNLKIYFSTFILISIFLYFQIFSSFRSGEYYSYFIYSEFFLILSLAILLKNIKKIFISRILVLLFTIPLVFQNFELVQNIKSRNNQNLCEKYFASNEFIKKRYNNHYKVWTNKFPLEVVKKFCDN